MTGRGPAVAASPPERLARSLPGPVEMRETHAAWVLLSGPDAYKIRKPVRFAFLDYSTLDRRLAACEEEVRVNQALAPGVYRGVRVLIERDGRLELGPAGRSPEAVEYAVEMRRFDERLTMAARCDRGELADAEVEAVAALLARFHAAAERCCGGADPFARRVRADVGELRTLLARERGGPERGPGGDARRADATGGDAYEPSRPRGNAPATQAAPALERFARAALARRAAELDERAARGCCRDGHGDLRAEHVVLGDLPLVVDRIEFDPALRRIDVGADLAFLAMDLEARGCAQAARRLVAGYRDSGGDPGSPGLRALFAWQRAVVRAKVALLRDDQAEAATLLALADTLAWRERLAGAVLVTGPPASGKSTLAGLLARRSGLPLIDSDSTRKRMLGAAPTDRLDADGYAEDVTLAVYRRLGAEAAALVAEHGSAIVDATGRAGALRAALTAALGDARPVLALCCDAPLELRLQRARARLADPQRVSDADEAVARRLAAAFEPPRAGADGIDRVVTVDTRRIDDRTLDELAARLDEGGG